MKKFIATLIINLLKQLFHKIGQSKNKESILVQKIINEANLSIGKGYGGKNTQEKEINQVVKLLDKNKKNLIIDVGANIGSYTENLKKIMTNIEVVLFEPNTENYNILINKFANKKDMSVQKYGLSDKREKAKLFSDFPGSGLASISKRNLEHFDIEFTYEEEINLIKFDDFWVNELSERSIDLIKLDIEGHELNALKGAVNSIKKTKLIQFEFGGCNIDSRTFFRDYWYFFTNNGFLIHRISPFGIIECKKYKEDYEFFKTTNYLAINSII